MTKENAKELHKIYEECQKIIESSIGTIDEFSYFENEQEKAFYVALRKFFVQPQYTLKMVIEFDEGKINKEGKYDVRKMYASLRKSFEGAGLKTVTDGVFVDNGNEEDLNEFMALATVFSKIDWFTSSIKRWDWYEDDWEEPENLIETFELVK